MGKVRSRGGKVLSGRRAKGGGGSAAEVLSLSVSRGVFSGKSPLLLQKQYDPVLPADPVIQSEANTTP